MISQKSIPKGLEKINPKEIDTLFPLEEIQILFLNNGVEKSVEAYEANSLPCSEIIDHLNRGESVFISKKKQIQNNLETNIISDNPDSSFYLNHI